MTPGDKAGDYFLIETKGITPTQYYCGPGNWCTNPDHAVKFHSWEAAVLERSSMPVIAEVDRENNMQITEHQWG